MLILLNSQIKVYTAIISQFKTLLLTEFWNNGKIKVSIKGKKALSLIFTKKLRLNT